MQSCFFTGHRSFSYERDTNAVNNLAAILPILAESGVTDFYAGGARGWDMYCELSVIVLKKYYPHLKLHLILPCPPEKQILYWNDSDKEHYKILLGFADSVDVISDDYDKYCMKKRNARLAELGDICVCYFNKNDLRSGTAQTVRMAEKANKTVLNMYFSPKEYTSIQL